MWEVCLLIVFVIVLFLATRTRLPKWPKSECFWCNGSGKMWHGGPCWRCNGEGKVITT